MSLFAAYCDQDRRLVAAGFPETSPWWLDQIRLFFESGKYQFVYRVGRRGGKSSTLCRMAVIEALHGDHAIPPGDTGSVSFISVTRDEAAERLRTIQQILEALGVEYKAHGASRTDLVHRPVAFRVFAANIGGVSGFTSICVICDEVAKWRDMTTGANPATEVLASVRPTTATMPNAKVVLSSSPLGELDAHAAAYAEGETPTQHVAFAPTWVANPTVSEGDTRQREPNEMRWAREYGAIPIQGSEDGVFISSLLDRAMRIEPALPYDHDASYVAWMDPATRGNAWTFAIATRRWVGNVCKASVVLACQWQGTPTAPLDPDLILAKIAQLCTNYALTSVHSDQHHADSLRSIGRRHGLSVIIEPSTDRTKMTRYEGLSERLSVGEVELPPDRMIRSDLLSVTRHLTPNGFTIRLPTTGDGRHADYAPTIAGAIGWRLPEPPRPVPPLLTPEDRRSAEADRLNAFAKAHWEKQHAARLRERAEAAADVEWTGLDFS